MDLAKLPCYVVSVRSFTDRHAHLNAQAQDIGLLPEYLWAYDVDTLTAEDLSRANQHALPLPSISAVLKHIEAQVCVCDRNQPYALILEDDVLTFPEFAPRLQAVLAMTEALDPGWLIFLGGADNKIDERFTGSSDFRLIEHPLSTAEAYLVDLDGCRRRLAWLSQHVIDRPADHLLTQLDQHLGIRQYWVSEPMATQGSITGLFETALDSNRRKHSRRYLSARYHLNRLRRQVIPRLLSKFFRTR